MNLRKSLLFGGTLSLLMGLSPIGRMAELPWKLRTAPVPRPSAPVPTIADSPVRFLRTLLARTPDQRTEILSGRSESSRQFWLKKVEQYEKTATPVREARLRVAQLHWYLLLLITSNSEHRHAKLAQIPILDRTVVERRLRQWEALPQGLQKDILDNIVIMRYFARLASLSPENRKRMWARTEDQSHPVNQPARSWHHLSVQRRQQMLDAYLRFFELPAVEQQKTISRIPMPERKAFRKRLTELAQLPLDERQRCLIALHAFAQMTSLEREQFRQNARRWKAMPPKEREIWTHLVRRFPPRPPLPHGGPPGSRPATATEP